MSERTLVFLVGAVQFVNILDFMMVMPLGPDFARALGIPTARLGYVGGSYTAAAAVAGVLGSTFLDRFDRRRALGVAMLGLVVGTALGGVAEGLGTLLLARVIAGAFGGPATSLSMSIIADVVPAERRGKALGAVMGAFSVASVLGVPLSLRLAAAGSWHTPFFVVAGLGLALLTATLMLLPPLAGHLAERPAAAPVTLGALLRSPAVPSSYATTFTVMFSGFVLIPNLSTFFQFNLGYPRDRIDLLYAVGGTVSFFALRGVGVLVDKFGAARVGELGVAASIALTWAGYYRAPPLLPAMALFVGFMVANAVRNVAHNALASRVPAPAERARFMSIQSTVQHVASSLAAFFSAAILVERADHGLERVPVVALAAMGVSALIPLLMRATERRLRAPAPPSSDRSPPSARTAT